MKKWHVILGVALVFVAGILTGVAGARLYVKSRIEKAIRGGPDAVRERVMAKLTRELRLSGEQKAEIEPVVKEVQMKLARLRAVYQPEVEQVIGEGIEQINPHLNPRQQEKIRAFYRQVQARWQPDAAR